MMVSCQKGPSPPCLRMADRALLAGYLDMLYRSLFDLFFFIKDNDTAE